MTITSLLELRLRPDAVAGAPAVLSSTLTATRAFPGCLGVDVTIDTEDETHVIVVEKWDTLESDDAYRAWRATPDGASELGGLLAGRPVLTRLRLADGV